MLRTNYDDVTPAREVGLREVILTIGTYLREARRFWYVILLAGVLLGGYRAYRAYTTPLRFQASMQFIVSNSNKGGGIALGGVLGQLGLGGGGGSAGGVNLKRVMMFATSRKLVTNMLLDSVDLAGRNDLLINHVIDNSGLREKWDDVDSYYGVREVTTDSIDGMTPIERSILKGVYAAMLYDPELAMINSEINEDNGLLMITTTSFNEGLSIYLARELFERLSDFYTLESTGQSMASVALLQNKADSILRELTQAEYSLANNFDTRQGLTQQRDQVARTQLGRKVSILSLAYTEVVRNLETAKFTLSTQTPFFQVVDEPIRPLNRVKPNWIMVALLNFVIGAIVAFVLISLRRLYLTVMREEPAA